MKYVIGVDLGTSAVKILLVNMYGEIVQKVSKPLQIFQPKTGYSEQHPNEWVDQTIAGLSDLLDKFTGDPADIEGISFSGQMHGLVLLDKDQQVLRPAILWNDTRTTEECKEIYEKVGKERLLAITKNPALEGFTLPKILWVKKHEPEIFTKVDKFVLPKDYVRFKLSGALHMDYSDAAGTLLLDVSQKEWSNELCELLDINIDICPPLVESTDETGKITSQYARLTGLPKSTRIFAGGADNACGAIGAGILEKGKLLCSIGTSGVVAAYETTGAKDFQENIHYFNHSVPDAYYSMGVTLAAGYSLTWFKDTFAPEKKIDELLSEVDSVPPGSNGLLFTPYLLGERTPHADATIRGSFIGIDSSHERKHFVRAVLEGITLSLNESIHIFREQGKKVNSIISIGGGAQNEQWLQIQADIFNAKIIKLSNEQGPGMGAAMLAAIGCNWFTSLQECAGKFLAVQQTFIPNPDNVEQYEKLFSVYREIYGQTKRINQALYNYRE
ncbi:MAG TPA: xylulokinase [Candidatus Avamphibacillus sp.]|nr:xylulokinase [Candidatus Avamphibacillus sp.]